MKSFLVKLSVLILLLAAGVGGMYYLYTSGWIEETLTHIRVPFHWFYDGEIMDVSSYGISNDGEANVNTYKEIVEPITEKLDTSEDKPSLRDLPLTRESQEKLENYMEYIYGVPNQYIKQFIVSGVSQTTEGWGPILTMSVVNDSTQVENISFTSIITENDEIHLLNEIANTSDEYWYPEIPSDFEMSKIHDAKRKAISYIEDEQYLNNDYDSSKIQKLMPYLPTSILNNVEAMYNTGRINVKYVVGVEDNIEELIFSYGIDSESLEEIK